MRLLTGCETQDPRHGLAVDEALLESVRAGAPDAVRLWVNDRTVVVGRSQAVADEVDLVAAESDGVPVLRRISGGGTVYHYPGNLNVSVALGGGRRIGSVGEVFRVFGEAIAEAARSVCGAVRARENDLLVGAAKVGGAAQARRGDALLYHTTLLIRPPEIPMDRWLRALRPGYRPTRVASWPKPTVSLTEAVGRDVPMTPLGEAIARSVGRALGAATEISALRPGEAGRAEQLVKDKYGDPQWNRSL